MLRPCSGGNKINLSKLQKEMLSCYNKWFLSKNGRLRYARNMLFWEKKKLPRKKIQTPFEIDQKPCFTPHVIFFGSHPNLATHKFIARNVPRSSLVGQGMLKSWSVYLLEVNDFGRKRHGLRLGKTGLELYPDVFKGTFYSAVGGPQKKDPHIPSIQPFFLIQMKVVYVNLQPMTMIPSLLGGSSRLGYMVRNRHI